MADRDKGTVGKTGGLVLAWAGAALAVGAFFLPWVRLEPSADSSAPSLQAVVGELAELGKVDLEIRHGGRTVHGVVPDLSTLPGRASGFEIPAMANRADVGAAVAFTEMLTGQRNLGPKSYLVYVLPVFAVALGGVLTHARRLRWACLAAALGCLAAATAGFVKLSKPPPQLLMMTVRVEPGLWLSWTAYLILAVGALALAWSASGRNSDRE